VSGGGGAEERVRPGEEKAVDLEEEPQRLPIVWVWGTELREGKGCVIYMVCARGFGGVRVLRFRLRIETVIYTCQDPVTSVARTGIYLCYKSCDLIDNGLNVLHP